MAVARDPAYARALLAAGLRRSSGNIWLGALGERCRHRLPSLATSNAKVTGSRQRAATRLSTDQVTGRPTAKEIGHVDASSANPSPGRRLRVRGNQRRGHLHLRVRGKPRKSERAADRWTDATMMPSSDQATATSVARNRASNQRRWFNGTRNPVVVRDSRGTGLPAKSGLRREPQRTSPRSSRAEVAPQFRVMILPVQALSPEPMLAGLVALTP